MKSFPIVSIFVLFALATASCRNAAFLGTFAEDEARQNRNLDLILHSEPSTPSRVTSYRPWLCYLPRQVSPQKKIPDEGRAEYSEILGEGEHRYVHNTLIGLDVKQDGLIPYKKTETTTTLFIPERFKGFLTNEQCKSGEYRNQERPTRIVLTIDNSTGEILVPADAPSLSEEELDTICRSLMDKLREERHWKFHESVWMDEIRRVSDWYYVSYRIREEPYRKGESYWFYTFWIDSRTRKVAYDQCGVRATDR